MSSSLALVISLWACEYALEISTSFKFPMLSWACLSRRLSYSIDMLILLVSSREAELNSIREALLICSLLCNSDFACLKGDVKLLILDGVRDYSCAPPFYLVRGCGSLLADIDIGEILSKMKILFFNLLKLVLWFYSYFQGKYLLILQKNCFVICR